MFYDYTDPDTGETIEVSTFQTCREAADHITRCLDDGAACFQCPLDGVWLDREDALLFRDEMLAWEHEQDDVDRLFYDSDGVPVAVIYE